jgi:hypothetical protein
MSGWRPKPTTDAEALFSGELMNDMHLLGERVIPQLARPIAAAR